MIVQHTPWKDKIKQAGINSFGFGGTNAHMVIQNYLGQVGSNSLVKSVKGKDSPLGTGFNRADNNANDKVDLQSMAVIGMDAHLGVAKT